MDLVYIVRAPKVSKALGGQKTKTLQSKNAAASLAKRVGGRFQLWRRPVKA